MTESVLPTVAITMGDPAGVGAEVIAGALAHPSVYDACRPLVIGDRRVMENAIRAMGTRATLVGPDELATPSAFPLMDLANVDLNVARPGRVSADAGRAAWEYIQTSVRLARDGWVQAVATAPINKEAIKLAGIPFPGHTEMFGHLTGCDKYTMMLVDGDMRVAHVSTHVSLRRACDLVRRERVLEVIRLLHGAVSKLGIPEPHIAVAGLNPHCGEGGLFGQEEAEEILPAVADARALGIRAEGPIPPDTVFAKAFGGSYDGVVAMYHDQGHIPMKSRGFKFDSTGRLVEISGVNVTLGLPIVRTSVEHGTAFDQAGKGSANPESMRQAILLAAAMGGSR
ncbi:MAG: 4-hydroxythreonine-4-phosphate dehydrogenase PdxA [Bacillota bacterium]